MSQDISSLTQDELSRCIAEHNEPLKTLPNAAAVVAVFSPLRSWIIKGSRDESWCDVRWVPRPYTDPEICLRLLKMIIDHDKDVIPDDRIIQSYFDICDERAIAEAYAITEGWRAE